MKTSLLFSIALLSGAGLIFWLSGCSTARSTKDLQSVQGFQPERYLGKWYEIARYPHFFERDLTNVTAEYKLPEGTEDGEIEKVLVYNRGHHPEKGWKTAEATATFAQTPDIGHLKVKFIPLFGADYKIIALDEDYEWAMITGSSRKYFWLLARESEIPDDLYEGLMTRANEDFGFDLEPVIKVDHSPIAESD
jgi:apolipoprotein D and lipocalin family protein